MLPANCTPDSLGPDGASFARPSSVPSVPLAPGRQIIDFTSTPNSTPNTNAGASSTLPLPGIALSSQHPEHPLPQPALTGSSSSAATQIPTTPADTTNTLLPAPIPEPPDATPINSQPTGSAEDEIQAGDDDGNMENSETGLHGPLLAYLNGVRETVKKDLDKKRLPSCYQRQTWWIRPPDPFFMKLAKTDTRIMPDHFYARPVFLWLPDLFIDMADIACPNPECGKKGHLQSKGTYLGSGLNIPTCSLFQSL